MECSNSSMMVESKHKDGFYMVMWEILMNIMKFLECENLMSIYDTHNHDLILKIWFQCNNMKAWVIYGWIYGIIGHKGNFGKSKDSHMMIDI